MISSKESPSADLVEDIVAYKSGILPGRNRSKQKHDENTIYKPRGIGGLYITKFHIKRKVLGENESEAESGVDSPLGGAARGGSAPQGGVSHPGSIPSLFRFVAFLID